MSAIGAGGLVALLAMSAVETVTLNWCFRAGLRRPVNNDRFDGTSGRFTVQN
jgi:hypothetical protein